MKELERTSAGSVQLASAMTGLTVVPLGICALVFATLTADSLLATVIVGFLVLASLSNFFLHCVVGAYVAESETVGDRQQYDVPNCATVG